MNVFRMIVLEKWGFRTYLTCMMMYAVKLARQTHVNRTAYDHVRFYRACFDLPSRQIAGIPSPPTDFFPEMLNFDVSDSSNRIFYLRVSCSLFSHLKSMQSREPVRQYRQDWLKSKSFIPPYFFMSKSVTPWVTDFVKCLMAPESSLRYILRNLPH
jgi:hypothetical protein